MVFLLGNWTTQFFLSFETMKAKEPPDLQKTGPVFGALSMANMGLDSGISESGITTPLSVSFTEMPSLAGMYPLLPSSYSTRATGVILPGSCFMSLTTPFEFLYSSFTLKLAFLTLYVGVPLPLLCWIILFPMLKPPAGFNESRSLRYYHQYHLITLNHA